MLCYSQSFMGVMVSKEQNPPKRKLQVIIYSAKLDEVSLSTKQFWSSNSKPALQRSPHN